MRGITNGHNLPLTRGALLHAAASGLDRLGLPLESYAKRAGVERAWLECERESVIPLHIVYRLLEAAAGDVDGIGALSGEIPVEAAGNLGEIIGGGLTVLDALERFIRFFPGFGAQPHPARLIRDEQTGGIWFARFKSFELESGEAQVELLLMQYVIQIGRLAAGPDFKPLALRFGSGVDAVRALESVPSFQGVPAKTGLPWGGVLFDERTLGLPLPPPQVASIEDAAEWLEHGPAGAPAIALRQLLLSWLRGGLDTHLNRLSEVLAVQPRSLQRLLQRDGASYRLLLDQARYIYARERILNESEVPLGEIAVDLGYSDYANFSRAFRRWSGAGPSALRSNSR